MKLKGMLKLAKQLSEYSNYSIKVGSVLVKSGNPIGVGFNKNKSHPDFKYTVHAEMSALINSGKESVKRSIIYVYRETADGIPANARPCSECLGNLKKFGVKKMIYTTSEYPYFNIENI